jgi:hypothetical protein
MKLFMGRSAVSERPYWHVYVYTRNDRSLEALCGLIVPEHTQGYERELAACAVGSICAACDATARPTAAGYMWAANEAARLRGQSPAYSEIVSYKNENAKVSVGSQVSSPPAITTPSFDRNGPANDALSLSSDAPAGGRESGGNLPVPGEGAPMMAIPRLKLLTLAFLLLTFLLVGVCVGVLIMPGPPRIVAFHDDVRSVTCWGSGKGGMSCWPDWLILSGLPR